MAKVFRSYAIHRQLLLLLLPGIAFYILFCYYPMWGVQIAFKDFNYKLGIWKSPWIGFEYFTQMLTSPSFGEVFRNTILISLYKLIFGFPAPIILALLLNEIYHNVFRKTVQTMSYLPNFMSWVIVGGLFMNLLSPSTGPVNVLIKSLGLKPIYFLGDPRWFRGTLVVTSIWKGVGWGSIVYMAAIAGINQELYEAAVVDGANRLQRVRYITIPELQPVITIMMIFAVGGIINDDFDQIFNLYNDAVLSVGDVISTYTYRRGLVGMEFSYATAVGLFKNIIAFALLIITNGVSRRISEYGLW